MKWSSQQPRRPDGHGGAAGENPLWMAPVEDHPPVSGDADHRVRMENHDASHTSLRTVDAAHRFLRGLGYR